MTGAGEPDASVAVYDTDGVTVLGTGTVQPDGTYSVTIPAQVNGEELSVTLTDAAGNESLPTSTLAPDLTAPDAPTADVDDATGTQVTGNGEPGATVTVYDVDGTTVLGTGAVQPDGSYSVTIPAQTNGEDLTVTQTDTAGNESLPATAEAPDLTAPDAPTADVDDSTGTLVTGMGEPGATVTVYDVDGTTVLGTGSVDPDGSYSVTIPAQTNGEDLTVTQTDAAGNESDPAAVAAPDQFDAFDNLASAALDLVPVTSDVDVGTANYLALVGLADVDLSLDVAGLQLLGIDALTFTVDDGHSLDALFEYGGVLDIGVAADYTVVVQQLVDGNWVGVGGEGAATLLELNLLGGDLTAAESLGAGDYRAFVTFDGLAGVGVLGTLDVTGTDNDFTDIADIVAVTAEGNVITDTNAASETDLAPAGTVVASVTFDGTTTDVIADGTIVSGDHGTLVIDLDGSYVYTPSEDAANIGAADSFTYTIERPDGAQESAVLVVEIGSPDTQLSWGAPGDDASTGLAAADDSASAAVLFENTVDTVETPLFSLSNGIIGTDSDSAGFTVAADTESDATVNIAVSSVITLFPTYTVTLTDTDSGATVDTRNVTAALDVLGLVSASVTFDDLPPGNYTIEVEAAGLGTGFDSDVVLSEAVTNLTEFQVDAVTAADGNLLANDTTGTLFNAVLVDSGSGFTEVGDTPVTLTGSHGTLTVDEAGNYHYEPDPALAYSASDLTDSFTYQVQHPNGETATAELTISLDTIDPGGALPAMAVAGAPAGLVMLAGFDDMAAMSGDEAAMPDALAYDLFEGQGDLVSVLENYLENEDSSKSDQFSELVQTDTNQTEIVEIDQNVSDPLSYLSINPDDDLSGNQHTLI